MSHLPIPSRSRDGEGRLCGTIPEQLQTFTTIKNLFPDILAEIRAILGIIVKGWPVILGFIVP